MNFENMPTPGQKGDNKKEPGMPPKQGDAGGFSRSKETPEDKAVALMRNSRSESEWDDNCDKIKAENNGSYPEWWHEKIISSGIAAETQLLWKE